MTTRTLAGDKEYRILVVDDEPLNRDMLSRLLRLIGYATEQADNGLAALESLRRELPDLILLDLEMPVMNGIELLKTLKADEKTREVPTIIVTGISDRKSRLTALHLGAVDFLTKPVDESELSIRVRNHLRLKQYGDFLKEHAQTMEHLVDERTAQLLGSYRETIYLLTIASEYRDEQTGIHVRRVSHFTSEVARCLGMTESFIDCIFYASPMHDIGKIAVPDRILYKPGPLDAEEWEIMKSHTTTGKRMLEKGTAAYIRMGAEIAESHHERWDGSGYPYGLLGEQIPLSGCIMSICDTYDALRSSRPYKEAFGHEETLRIITEGDGRTDPRHFRPDVLGAFKDSRERFRAIYADHS
jgi:putative two-component system response regulator